MLLTARKIGSLSMMIGLFAASMGCDPGMIIRQHEGKDAAVSSEEASDSNIAIRVADLNALIGETWYAPEVDVTNTGAASIHITKFELVTSKRVYLLSERFEKKIQRNIDTGGSVHLRLWFDLDEPVYRAFHDGAALKVYYEYQGREFESSVLVKGVGLRRKRPTNR